MLKLGFQVMKIDWYMIHPKKSILLVALLLLTISIKASEVIYNRATQDELTHL